MTAPQRVLLDSNIVIYAAQPQYPQIRDFIRQNVPVVSAITYVETLGFHKLTESEKSLLKAFFSLAEILPIESLIVERAIGLRQLRKMSLGDSIIAATSLVHHITLVTRNTSDFIWIPGIALLDPLATST